MASVFSEHYFDYADLKVWGERREKVFADVVRLLKSRGVRKVFDVGAAFGHFVKYAQEMGLEAAGSDISGKAVEVGREQLGVELYAGALDELSLPDESVDAVVSLDAFYYVAEPRAELDAMRRLVKPGGLIVLRLRNSLWSRFLARAAGFRAVSRASLPAPHLWGFTPQSITQLLEVSGWRVEECQPAPYSRSVFAPLQSVAITLNRVVRLAWHRAPILTRSFNVVARRTN
jgi:SAM-dependent methyltransferase